jgi:hypothetical protein
MNFSRPNFSRCLIALVVLCVSTAAFAKLPTRRSSQNGEDINAAHWNLLSVSQPLTLSAKGKKVTITRQIICVNQDVENAQSTPDVSLTGTCEGGLYLHVFQLKSTSGQPVTVNIRQLTGFVADDGVEDGTPNYGVLTCDSPDNTLELCTNDTNPDDIPDIAFSVAKNKTRATYVIPNFPDCPAGVGNQGQGLTLFILVQQASPLPIQIPTIGIQ